MAAVAVAAVAIGLALVAFQDSAIVQALYHQVLSAARLVAWVSVWKANQTQQDCPFDMEHQDGRWQFEPLHPAETSCMFDR